MSKLYVKPTGKSYREHDSVYFVSIPESGVFNFFFLIFR